MIPENAEAEQQCRPGCGACCTVISISSPLPGMPKGKPAGVRCANLDQTNRCTIHGKADYPEVCRKIKAEPEMCGKDKDHAMRYLARLEQITAPLSD